MKRSVRRHQQRVAKLRRISILRAHGVYDAWHGLSLSYSTPHWEGPETPWRPLTDFLLKEPRWWVHDMVLVPARIDTHQLERAIESGREPDSVIWPDCRRPYPYYW